MNSDAPNASIAKENGLDSLFKEVRVFKGRKDRVQRSIFSTAALIFFFLFSWISLLFLDRFSRKSLFFIVFLSFPKYFGGSARTQIPCFFGDFPCLFLKKQEKEDERGSFGEKVEGFAEVAT